MSGPRLRHSALGRALGLAALASSLLAATACTARQGYEGLRTGARNDCALQPAPEYERCLERLQMDYEAYREQPPPPRDDATESARTAPADAAPPSPPATPDEAPEEEPAGKADGAQRPSA